jgi:hypothetical protein
MATQTISESEKLVIDPKWRRLPMILLTLGAIAGLIGLFVNPKQFSYSYLLAFMFFLAICLGATPNTWLSCCRSWPSFSSR